MQTGTSHGNIWMLLLSVPSRFLGKGRKFRDCKTAMASGGSANEFNNENRSSSDEDAERSPKKHKKEYAINLSADDESIHAMRRSNDEEDEGELAEQEDGGQEEEAEEEAEAEEAEDEDEDQAEYDDDATPTNFRLAASPPTATTTHLLQRPPATMALIQRIHHHLSDTPRQSSLVADILSEQEAGTSTDEAVYIAVVAALRANGQWQVGSHENMLLLMLDPKTTFMDFRKWDAEVMEAQRKSMDSDRESEKDSVAG